MPRTDILMTPDEVGLWDLTTKNGDWVVESSDQMHIEMILQSAPGHWREHPLLGADIEELLNGPATLTELRAKINVQMELDGYAADTVRLERENEENWTLNVLLDDPPS